MRLVFICFLISITIFCSAQHYYETYTPANGLVDARINKIIQDGFGRMFFLTRDGISIYDGQRFTNHTKLAGNVIGIVDDALLLPAGNLQLALFSGNWINSRPHSSELDTILYKSIPEVSSLIPLKNNEHLIVSNYGLYLKKASSLAPLLQVDNARRFIEHVAVSGEVVVFKYHNENRSFIYSCFKNTGILIDSLSVPAIYSINTDSSGNIFICSTTGILQLDSRLLKTGKLKTHSPGFEKFIPSSFTAQKLFFDRQQHAWLIDPAKGCYQLNTNTGLGTLYSPADGLFTGISDIYQDYENNFWFIANGKGVQKLVQTNFEIVNTIGTYSLGQTYAITSANDSTVYFLTDGRIISHKNLRSQKHDLAKKSISTPFIAWGNKLWEYNSPSELTSENGDIIKIRQSHSSFTPPHYTSFHVSTDKKGRLLLSGNRFAFVESPEVTGSYALPYFADNIVEDDKETFWAFCRSNHIVALRIIDNQIKKEAEFIQTGIEPRFAMHWNKDTFWLATRYNGILIVKADQRSLVTVGKITRQNGLSNDFVETLLKIDGQRVAAGTAAGLDMITLSGTDTVIENVSARINHFEPILQLARDNSGLVFARSENLKVFKLDPNFTAPGSYHPKLWLEEISVNGRRVTMSDNRFTYNENNFYFSASTPSFIDNRNIIFHFVLTGENDKWEQNSNKADFSINNLMAGDYTLTLASKYPGNIYPSQELVYTFSVALPFWKTWWFIGLLVVVVLATLIAFTRSFLQRQIQKQKIMMEKELAIEQERTRMARELHDGLGSMLSGIKHSFSAIKKQVPLNDEQEEKFDHNIDRLNESITELRNISHSMASESLLKYGLENSLSDYCRHISQPGNLVVSFESLDTEKMQLTEEQAFHIFRIVQELLQNSIKHSGASTAIVQLSYNNHRLYLTVEDNGKGFTMNKEEHKKGMGLKNIETRIKTLRGKMDYQSSPSKGTSVLIEIPCEEKQ
jgi:signal transduction histidine kinase